MSKIQNYFKLSSLALATAMAGFSANFINAYSNLPINNKTPDLSVVFNGNNGRIKNALENFINNCHSSKKWLLISGVSETTSLDSIAKANKIEIPSNCSKRIISGTHALKTVGNAKETKEALDFLKHDRKYPVRSITIQTSWCHMPRSYTETKKTLPKKIDLKVQFVSHCGDDYKKAMKNLVLEVVKLPFSQFGYAETLATEKSFNPNGRFVFLPHL